jgi:hypothetical protein
MAAHIGLLPDLVADLKVVGLSDAALEPLFHSAEAYINVWQKMSRCGLGRRIGECGKGVAVHNSPRAVAVTV